ncbi:MAG: hypothetical protein OQL09_10595, partial [Gammaproteobacteria bacterium]|nr:hypothetical protein [Gammaproteobacteria bacterium]
NLVQAAIRTIRDIKSKRNIPPSKMLVVSVKSQQETVEILNANAELIRQLAGVKEFKAGIALVKPANAAISIMEDATEVYVHDAVDVRAEREKLEKQKQQAAQRAKQEEQRRAAAAKSLAQREQAERERRRLAAEEKRKASEDRQHQQAEHQSASSQTQSQPQNEQFESDICKGKKARFLTACQ